MLLLKRRGGCPHLAPLLPTLPGQRFPPPSRACEACLLTCPPHTHCPNIQSLDCVLGPSLKSPCSGIMGHNAQLSTHQLMKPLVAWPPHPLLCSLIGGGIPLSQDNPQCSTTLTCPRIAWHSLSLAQLHLQPPLLQNSFLSGQQHSRVCLSNSKQENPASPSSYHQNLCSPSPTLPSMLACVGPRSTSPTLHIQHPCPLPNLQGLLTTLYELLSGPLWFPWHQRLQVPFYCIHLVT